MHSSFFTKKNKSRTSKSKGFIVKYTSNRNFYQLKLSLNIDYIIPVRLLSQFIEEIDLEDLYATYSRIRGNQAAPHLV